MKLTVWCGKYQVTVTLKAGSKLSAGFSQHNSMTLPATIYGWGSVGEKGEVKGVTWGLIT
jgi:hypothetical protein